jgi:hypothetical protein
LQFKIAGISTFSVTAIVLSGKMFTRVEHHHGF